VALVAGAFAAAYLPAGSASAQVSDYRQIKFPAVPPFNIPEPERYVLKNGLVVLLMEDHELPLIGMQVRVRTGSRLEPAEKTGLASITGQVLRTGGAGKRTGDAIDDFLEARGALIETGISTASGSAFLSSLKGDFTEVLGILADILRSPAFDEAKIKIAKTQQMASIARRNDDPMNIMFREGQRLIYGADSPYARTTEYATINSITRDDLKAFHARYFLPNRTYLGVVGDFDPKEMKKTLEAVFGDWPKGPEAKDSPAAYQKTPKPGFYRIAKTDMTQSDVYMGHLGIRQDNPDYFAATVMNEVFSGSFASRLFSNIRSAKGLAYSVRGSLGANFDYPGSFTAWLTTKTETTAAAIEALLEEIDALVRRPPTEEEVRRAKESILNSFVFNYDSRAEILAQQLTYEYFGYPRDFLTRYRQNVEKITPADVARVAKTYVKKGDLAILVVGRMEGLDRPLESFGRVATIDITIPEPAGGEAKGAP
jgi:zinc protease